MDSDIPGEGDIYFIFQDGQLPEETTIQELERFLQDEKVRPLTDKVIVRAPDVEEYEIDFTYYINRSDRTKISAINEQVQKAVQEYISWQKKRIGRDINPDQLRRMLVSAGAKRLEIRSPDFRRITRSSIAILKGDASVVYGGVEDV